MLAYPSVEVFYTTSSADIKSGFMYSKPSNSDWSILSIRLLKRKMRKIENEKIEKIRYCLYQCKRGYILWTRKNPKYYMWTTWFRRNKYIIDHKIYESWNRDTFHERPFKYLIKSISYVSSGVSWTGSSVNSGGKFARSLSDSSLGRYGGGTCFCSS